MNEKRQEILRLCADKPKTARELVMATGENNGTVRSRLHDLVKLGALKRTAVNDQYGTYLYEAIPGWRSKQEAPPLTAYRPLGICVLGVWM